MDGVGPRIPGFDNLEIVGEGGYAVVYRAWQPAFDRWVALKVLTNANPSPAARAAFVRECRAIGSLSDHPSVVPVYAAGETSDGRPYLAMAYLPDGSIADLMERGPLPVDQVVRYGAQVAEALAAAHALGTLHRDLKPANMLLGRSGEIRLADFGIASVAGVDTTAEGLIKGTVAYLAPEVLAGGRPSVAADVYALGVSLAAMITGTSPFRTHSEEVVAAVMARVLDGREKPNVRRPGVPDPLVDLVERCMATNPDHRPASAAAVASALWDIDRSLGEAHSGAGATVTTGPPLPPGLLAGAAAASGPPSEPPSPRSGRAKILVAVAAVVVVALVAGWFVTRPDDAETVTAREIRLESSDVPTPNRFMPSVITDDAPALPIDESPSTTSGSNSATGDLRVERLGGSGSGLYGGSRQARVCDKEKLTAFLTDPANRALAGAWADVLGIERADIESYIERLTPVILTHDTRVRNHGYSNGRATPVEAILQAGTAVLVNEFGVPRVKCECGNPLTDPRSGSGSIDITGDPWDGFDPATVTQVDAADDPLASIELLDVENPDAGPFVRPVGSDGDQDHTAIDLAQECTNGPTGYTVHFPEGWFEADRDGTNKIGENGVCSRFDPQREFANFYMGGNRDWALSVTIAIVPTTGEQMSSLDEVRDRPGHDSRDGFGEVLEVRDMTISDHPVRLVVSTGAPDAFGGDNIPFPEPEKHRWYHLYLEFDGRVVDVTSGPRFDTEEEFAFQEGLVIAVAEALETGRGSEPEPEPEPSGATLRGDGLGEVDFGTDAQPAIDALTEQLGPPTGDFEAGPEGTACNARARQISWEGMRIEVLIAEGGDESLRFWAAESQDPSPDLPTTAEGIGLGSTVSEVEAAYPGVQFELQEGGGEIEVSSANLLGIDVTAEGSTVTRMAAGNTCALAG